MWNDHWSIMKPAYVIIWFFLTLILDFLYNDILGPNRLYSINMWSTPAVWKQYNIMAVSHFFLVNSPLIYIYILFSMLVHLHTFIKRRVCTLYILPWKLFTEWMNDKCPRNILIFQYYLWKYISRMTAPPPSVSAFHCKTS